MYEGIRPVPVNAPRIPIPVLKQLVNADFALVTNLGYVPSPVKESFCNIERCDSVEVKFDMVNPDDTMSTDYIIPGVPNKRLVFAALNRESAIIVYERGGFANYIRTIILDFKSRRTWDSTLNYSSIKNVQDLRAELMRENYAADDGN